MGWLSGFSKRLKLTIQPDNVDNSLIDFPVMINLSSSAGKNDFDATSVFDELGDDHQKRMAVTKNDGTTQCPVEIEYWDATEEKAILWTKIPTVYSSVDTDIYFYYDVTTSGNTVYVGETGDTSAQNVWDDNFKAVYHMAQDPSGGSGAIKDSTSNVNNGTSGGAMISGDLVDGKIGKGIDFDGNNDYINCGHADSLDITSAITIETTINRDTIDVFHRLISKRGGTNGYDVYIGGVAATNNDLTFDFYSSNIIQSVYGPDILLGWKHTVVTYDQTNVIFYVNGIADSHSQSGAIDSDASGDLFIGIFCNGSTHPFEGINDEIRISNVVRSAPWIKATYHSNWDNFIIFQQEEITTNWLTNWSKRIKLTIDHTKVDTTLVDFPIAVTLASGTNTEPVFDELSTVSGTKKIALTTDDGTSQCYVEIERWNWTEQEANLWTKVPVVHNDEDTILYLYYDKTKDDNMIYVGDTGDGAAQNVWDSNFKLVMHMAQDPNGDVADAIKDSTSNVNHGTPAGSMTSADSVDGKIGKAIDFDGNDTITISADVSLKFGVGNFTIETIFKTSSANALSQITYGDRSDSQGWSALLGTSGVGKFIIDDATTQTIVADAVDHADGVSHYYAAVMNRTGEGLIYIDEALTNTTNISESSLTLDTVDHDDITIGANWSGSGWSNFFLGSIDEVRISNSARSAAWIKATYHSNWNSLITYGSEQERPIFLFNGYVKVEGLPAARAVYLYRRSNGELVGDVISNSSTGYFEIGSNYNEYHYVVILPKLTETYNLLSYDKIHV